MIHRPTRRSPSPSLATANGASSAHLRGNLAAVRVNSGLQNANDGDQFERDRLAGHELRRRLVNFARTCGLANAEALEVSVNSDTIILSGHFDSDDHRFLCVDTCRRIARSQGLAEHVDCS